MQTAPMTGFGDKVEFGGVLAGGMEMEEEILWGPMIGWQRW